MAPKRSCCIPFSCCCFSSSSSSDEKRQVDHPTSAGAPSSPSATDNTIETLPRAPKKREMAPKRSRCIRFCCCCFSSSSSSDEKGQDQYPTSAEGFSLLQMATTSVILHKDIEDVNIHELMKHISELLNLRHKEMYEQKTSSNPSSFPWPPVESLKKLKDILSSVTESVSTLKDITTVLKDIGQVSCVATAGLLVVCHTLERFHDVSTNKETCWDLIKEMSSVGNAVQRLKDSSKGTQEDVIEQATALVVEGAIICCTQIRRSDWKSFFTASKDKDDLSDMRRKLNIMYDQINMEIGLRISNDIERVLAGIAPRNSPLSREYPKHAVGIEESIEEVKKLLECENEKNNVVTVILHGFGGIGKTTLADAVFSQVKGGKCSGVQLSDDISSKPDIIIQLQRKILAHLMEPGKDIPEIMKPENGRQELGKILEKVKAFIYIDNVLDQVQLELLLPQDLDKAKKVRFLLTARNKNVKLAFPSCMPTKIYPMEGIKNPEAARSILKKDIKFEELDGSQFDKIIKICHGIPLMLKLVARFIGHADDKRAAYSEVMQDEEKWNNEFFNEMHLRFAYNALPEKCKDPFMDICSYFKGWDWDTVENIVGKYELEMLESRALVTKDTSTGVVNVHDVILELGFHMSKGKEVRLSFTSARELKAYLEEKKEGAAEGIKGIWLTDNKDILQISALTLDFMHNSLRVLQLGKLTEVEGKCSKIFEKLVFFEAKVPQFPFLDVSKFKQLRYLSYAPNELQLFKMPTSLRHVDLGGCSELGELFHCLSSLQGLEKLSDRFGQLKSLKVLDMRGCTTVQKLPEGFGLLTNLERLDLGGCRELRELCNDFHCLPSLQQLHLTSCQRLEKLPDRFGQLKSLRVLDMRGCTTVQKLPEGFGQLTNLERLDLEGCRELRELCNDFHCLSSLQQLRLTSCQRLEKLPPDFHLLTSLQTLYLFRNKLERFPETD